MLPPRAISIDQQGPLAQDSCPAGIVLHSGGEIKTNLLSSSAMDEGRKRVIGIMAAIMANLHMRTADDLFGGPEGSPKTDKI